MVNVTGNCRYTIRVEIPKILLKIACKWHKFQIVADASVLINIPTTFDV